VDARGIRDAIVDGVTGILVRASEGEMAVAFAGALVDLAADADSRKRLGVAARERAMEFSWERCVDSWQAVLEEVAT